MKLQQNIMAEHQCVLSSVLNSVSGLSTVGSKRSDSALHGLQLEVSAEQVCTQFSVLQGPGLQSRVGVWTKACQSYPLQGQTTADLNLTVYPEELGCQFAKSLCFQREPHFCKLFASSGTMFLFHAFRFTLTFLPPRTII